MPSTRALENAINWERERVGRLENELHALNLELIETTKNLDLFKIEMGSKIRQPSSDRESGIDESKPSSGYKIHSAPAYQFEASSANSWIQRAFPLEVRMLLIGVLFGFILCANLLIQ